MEIHAQEFGSIEIDGTPYNYDVVINAGRVWDRQKGPSEAFRGRYGHTPVSVGENLPWGGDKLIIGTGYHRSLPVMKEVYDEAKRRGVEIVIASTPQACCLLRDMEDRGIFALLHVTC
ncbi:MAG: MTH938/NDUFAF3 family protein [Verrucomicrobiota bacterium]